MLVETLPVFEQCHVAGCSFFLKVELVSNMFHRNGFLILLIVHSGSVMRVGGSWRLLMVVEGAASVLFLRNCLQAFRVLSGAPHAALNVCYLQPKTLVVKARFMQRLVCRNVGKPLEMKDIIHQWFKTSQTNRGYISNALSVDTLLLGSPSQGQRGKLLVGMRCGKERQCCRGLRACSQRKASRCVKARDESAFLKTLAQLREVVDAQKPMDALRGCVLTSDLLEACVRELRSSCDFPTPPERDELKASSSLLVSLLSALGAGYHDNCQG